MITNQLHFPSCTAHEELRARENKLRHCAKEPRALREAAAFADAAVSIQRLRFAHIEACRLCQMIEATRAA